MSQDPVVITCVIDTARAKVVTTAMTIPKQYATLSYILLLWSQFHEA